MAGTTGCRPSITMPTPPPRRAVCSTWPASLQCHAGHCHVVHCITSVARAMQQRRYHTCIGRTAGDVCWQLLGRFCSLAVALPWASCKPYAHWFHATFFLTHSGMQESQPSTVSQCSEHAVAHASMHCLGRPWRRKGGPGRSLASMHGHALQSCILGGRAAGSAPLAHESTSASRPRPWGSQCQRALLPMTIQPG